MRLKDKASGAKRNEQSVIVPMRSSRQGLAPGLVRAIAFDTLFHKTSSLAERAKPQVLERGALRSHMMDVSAAIAAGLEEPE
jgi:hypothetical protein